MNKIKTLSASHPYEQSVFIRFFFLIRRSCHRITNKLLNSGENLLWLKHSEQYVGDNTDFDCATEVFHMLRVEITHHFQTPRIYLFATYLIISLEFSTPQFE